MFEKMVGLTAPRRAIDSLPAPPPHSTPTQKGVQKPDLGGAWQIERRLFYTTPNYPENNI